VIVWHYCQKCTK